MQLLPGLYVTAFALLAGLSRVYAGSASRVIDTGDIFCTGQCVQDPAELSCKEPLFRAQSGCFMCCYSDDNIDGFDDDLPEDFEDGQWED